MPLGTEVNLGPGDVVLDGVAVPPPKKKERGTVPQFSAYVCCGRSRPSRLLLSSFVQTVAQNTDSCSSLNDSYRPDTQRDLGHEAVNCHKTHVYVGPASA